MNLLMVNDEALTAETMKTEIPWEQYGIDQVFTAYSAMSGRKCIEKHHIDILLCDIEMPGENGISLLRWVREQKKEIECIFLTCHATFAYAQEAIALGCQDYLLIPAKYETVGQAVLKVVNRIKAREEERRYQEYGRIALKEKIDQASQEYKKERDPRLLVSKIVTYIAENLGDAELSVNEIAEKFFIHPVYLNRIFRREKGSSISQYIIEERMKLAGEMLRNGMLGVNAVAEQVGYRYYSNFHFAFKKYFGCTPGQYHEEQIKKGEKQK